jgi:hypothetical protein
MATKKNSSDTARIKAMLATLSKNANEAVTATSLGSFQASIHLARYAERHADWIEAVRDQAALVNAKDVDPNLLKSDARKSLNRLKKFREIHNAYVCSLVRDTFKNAISTAKTPAAIKKIYSEQETAILVALEQHGIGDRKMA